MPDTRNEVPLGLSPKYRLMVGTFQVSTLNIERISVKGPEIRITFAGADKSIGEEISNFLNGQMSFLELYYDTSLLMQFQSVNLENYDFINRSGVMIEEVRLMAVQGDD